MPSGENHRVRLGFAQSILLPVDPANTCLKETEPHAAGELKQ
jgi:hypothetical protein